MAKVECATCNGACCKWFGVFYPASDTMCNRFYSQRGCRITAVENGRKVALVQSTCPDLDKETGKCRIYDHRPAICALGKVGNKLCRFIRKLEGVAQ